MLFFSIFLDEKEVNTLHLILSRICPDGEIGRHARFRFWCRKVCRFESYSGHITGNIFRNESVSGFFILISTTFKVEQASRGVSRPKFFDF